MKKLVFLLIVISNTLYAGEFKLRCVEFSSNVETESTSLDITNAANALASTSNPNILSVSFKVSDNSFENGCYKYVVEIGKWGNESLKLDIEKTNNFCVYDNRGIKNASYGFVCNKLELKK